MESLLVRSFSDLVRIYAATTPDFFFLQVGANDGWVNDPIYHLVHEFGWRGVLVEPQKWVFEERLVPHYEGCPGLEFENAAVSDRVGFRDLFVLPFTQRRWATGLASFVKDNLTRHIEKGYVEQSIGTERDQLPDRVEDYIGTERVRTVTFEWLIEKYGFDDLDLLQMDAEGYDYTLLHLFDFDRIKPAIVQFERHAMTPAEWTDVRTLLAEAGYLTFPEGINAVAFRQCLADSLELRFDVGDLRFSEDANRGIWTSPVVRVVGGRSGSA